jgi:hypothetical protein
MDGDVPQPDARHAFVGEANPADALPAFEHAIVTHADCSELEHAFWPLVAPKSKSLARSNRTPMRVLR